MNPRASSLPSAKSAIIAITLVLLGASHPAVSEESRFGESAEMSTLRSQLVSSADKVAAESGQLKQLSETYQKLTLEITCDHGCLIGDLCFKEYTRQLRLDLSKSWPALLTQHEQLTQLIRNQNEQLEERLTDLSVSEDNPALFTRDLDALQQSVQQYPVSGSHALQQIDKQVNQLISGSRDYFGQARQEIAADERCTREESSEFDPVEQDIQDLNEQLQESLSGLRSTLQERSTALDSLESLSQAARFRQLADEAAP